MFEDSTFESSSRIHSRSRRWMLAAFLVNGSILTALILIPLIYPEALSSQRMTFLMCAPAPAAEVRTRPPQPTQSVPNSSQRASTTTCAAPIFSTQISRHYNDDAPPMEATAIGNYDPGIPGGIEMPVHAATALPIVRPASRNPMRVSSSIIDGLLIQKTIPPYPPIAKASHTEGKVVLAATISKSGTIENLRVVGGPVMLRQAAMDAVRTWRYRPYQLNGEAIEVETTVDVIFTMGG